MDFLRQVYSQRKILMLLCIWVISGTSIFSQQTATFSPLNTTKISLPSGPGSIEGMGESFEPQWNSGTYRISVPLKLPALRGAVQPEISLGYDSGNGNGPAGMGWRLSVPFVQRQTDKGMPRYGAEDTIIDWTGEELVRLADGTWRAENESSFVKWEHLGVDGWRAVRPDGTVLKFGGTAQARLERPAALGSGVFRWLLESAEDTNGNRVEYRYTAHRTAGAQGETLQVYLSEIEWGFHFSEASQTLKLTLNYDSARPDPVEDFRGGFRISTQRRLESLMLTQGARRLRHWSLGYQKDAPVSLLESFKVYGDERAVIGAGEQKNRDYLPPVTFHYAPAKLGTDTAILSGGAFFDVSFAKGEADFVDLNRDGLPDLLFAESGTYVSRLNRGPGQVFGPATAFTSDVFLPALTTPGVKLADFRGDARTRVLIPDNGSFYYRDFTGPVTVGGDVDYAAPGHFPLTDPQVQLMDVNNDRALDFLALDGGRASYILSSPSGGAPVFGERPPDPALAGVNFTNGEWQLADMNGDRIPDLVQIALNNFSRDGFGYRPGMGYGRFAPDVPVSGGPLERELGSRGRAGLSLVDLDLDGLADLVSVESGVVKIWRNLAGRAWAEPVTITRPEIPDWNDSSTAVRFVDLNGSGTVDIVWNDPPAGIFLRALELHPATRPNQLARIENGLGKSTEILYGDTTSMMLAAEAAGNPWTVKPPFPLPVVKGLIERDGMGGEYATEVVYRNGYYDAAEREFRGFETAIRTEVGNIAQGAPSLVTEYLFHTGADVEALKGRPRQVERREEGGAVFDRVLSAWQTRQLPLTPAAGEARRVTYCFQENETSDILEKGSGAAVRLFKEMEWDDWGNQTRLADYGRVEEANRLAGEDERVVTRTFTGAFPSGRERWILNLPVDETVADGNGVVKTKTESFYDDETFAGGNRGTVVKGNLTLQRQAVDVAEDKWIKAARNRYDALGNVTHVFDPLGDPGNTSAGHFRVFSYDPDFHTYVESERIELGDTGAVPRLTASATYDKALGVMTGSKDFNGNESIYRYDTFARIAAIIKPGDTEAAPTEVYDYKLGMPVDGGRILNWITASKRETAGGGTVDARMFFDGLSRKVMTRSEGETPEQTVVTDTVVFNERRTEWKRYLPYFDTGGLDWKGPTFEAEFVENSYDATGRLTGAVNPPETTDGPRKSTRTDFRPLQTVLYDEEDNDPASPHTDTPHVQYKDGLGRLVGVDENKGGEIWPTRYAYDVLDNLTRITDSQGNVKTIEFDGLKRMTGMDDPDRGVMTYTFDDASNLTDTVDAKGQRIVMTYDGANRIQTEDYKDAAGLSPDVRYFYDTPATVPAGDGSTATGEQTLGKLSSVTDLSGGEALSYDTRGRIAWRIKRVPDPVTGVPVSYRSVFGYDSLDRLTRLTYPDGDHAGYGYNPRGLAESISGGPGGFIISNINYIATGQLFTCQYGNGVKTSYGYDPRQRLNRLTTGNPAAPLIDFSYTFDGASNITAIDDKRPGIPAGDPRRNTQVFQYDDLYRIAEVKYPAILNGGPGAIGYDYDRIGNMVSQTSNIADTENGLPVTNLGTMSYGGSAGPKNRTGRDGGQPGPHALTAVSGGSRSYPYDANGNMEKIDGMTCTWDFKDRLIAVENDQMRAEYTYDYTDRRIAKTVRAKGGAAGLPPPPETTLYVDRTFEIRPGAESVKYIWNGETRVARVTASLNAAERLQRFRLHKGWNFCALAVSVTGGKTQFNTAPVREVYRYDAATQTCHTLAAGEALPAGALLRVFALAAGELTVRGVPGTAVPITYPAGRRWIANTGFQPVSLGAPVPSDALLWFFDAGRQGWRYRLPGALGGTSDAPARLEPGEAVFAAHTAAFTLAPADPALEVRYYHQDHLGSSSVMTGAGGQLVSESAFYPFGHPRNKYEPRGVKESYGFTQKEKDGESGLNYFEARSLIGSTGRFASVDPFAKIPEKGIGVPQKANVYSYCSSSPLIFIDPTGCEGQNTGGFKFEGGFGGGSATMTFACGNDLIKTGIDATYSQNLLSGDDRRLSGTVFGEVAGQRLLEGGVEYNFSTGEGSVSGGLGDINLAPKSLVSTFGGKNGTSPIEASISCKLNLAKIDPVKNEITVSLSCEGSGTVKTPEMRLPSTGNVCYIQGSGTVEGAKFTMSYTGPIPKQASVQTPMKEAPVMISAPPIP